MRSPDPIHCVSRDVVIRRAARLIRSALIGGLLVGPVSCGTLPAAGPSTDDVVERFNKSGNPLGVRLVDLNPAVTQAVLNAPRTSLKLIDALRSNRSADRIGPGDVLSIAIYETGPGLFNGLHGADSGAGLPSSSGGSGNPSAGAASGVSGGGSGTSAETLPRLQVGRNGRISVPYAGDIAVAGHTPAEVQGIIQSRLAGKTSQAQVLVSVVGNDSNVVFVSGDVRSSGRFPLTLSGENVLDAIALAGGPSHAPQDTLVKMTRRGEHAQTTLTDVQNIPSENIPVEPQDRIQVDYDPRTFLLFGATGRVAQVPFDQARVSLAEAVARGGGLDDQRANPASLFLFRFEPPPVARALGLPESKTSVPVIYRVDMRDPQNFFLLGQFTMRDKDMIYVANAPTVQLYKFLQIINSVFTPVVYSRAAAGN